MFRSAVIMVACLGGVLVAGVLPVAGNGGARYAGSERCKECHEEKYRGWAETFHATVVRDVRKNPSAVLGDFSVAGLGFTLDEVEYAIGGHWDQRYMKKIGDDYYVLPKLWSVQSRTWRPNNVWSWKKMPYSKYCKGCHVTGFNPGEGTTSEDRVGCEACHGPAAAHAEAGGKGQVVNPAKLDDELRDMVCAACHVRGQDLTATYYFPVGFTPGQDLGEFYVPGDKAEGETNRQAIVRNFNKWKDDRATRTKTRCEVCGIFGGNETRTEDESASDFCFGCHDFKNKYGEHTRHRADVQLVCFDCHVQQTKDIMNPQNLDIHTLPYYLIHADSCYDPEIEKACAKCHAERGVEWARSELGGWRKPELQVSH